MEVAPWTLIILSTYVVSPDSALLFAVVNADAYSLKSMGDTGLPCGSPDMNLAALSLCPSNLILIVCSSRKLDMVPNRYCESC